MRRALAWAPPRLLQATLQAIPQHCAINPPRHSMAARTSHTVSSAALGARGAELFHEQAALYAQYRPDYPEELYSAILRFAGLPEQAQLPVDRQEEESQAAYVQAASSSRLKAENAERPHPTEGGLVEVQRRPLVALDVATGSGQVAAALVKHFDHVLACDSTQRQLDHAVCLPGISYLLAPAERLEGVGPASVDLLTVAQAAHWFDLPTFFKEARRVLRPSGTLAIWGYGMPFFSSSPGRTLPPTALAGLRLALQQMHTGTLGTLWDPLRCLVDNKYLGMEPGPRDFATVVRLDLTMRKDWSMEEVLGYISSWSSYTTHRRQHPDEPDPLDAFRQQLLAALKSGEVEEAGAGEGDKAGGDAGSDARSTGPALRLEWPLFVILAKDPKPLPGAGRGGSDAPC